MIFKNYQRNQSVLLPPTIIDFLGESHEVVILSEFLSEINTSELEASYKNKNGGRAAYHPVALLSILIYGYMNGIFSSRQLAKQLRQNLAFMYLAGNMRPDFRTLARFRKEKGVYLENIFSDVVRKAQKMGLVQFNICSLDGTKIYASASTSKNRTQKATSDKIRALIEEAEKIDQIEDKEFGDEEDGGDPELRTKAGRDKKKKELEERRKAEDVKLKKLNSLSPMNRDTRVNLTDPDSRLMQMKRKDFANGYNVQNITENGLILSSSIFNTSNDINTLALSLEELKNRFKYPKIILADKGYSSENNYTFCEKNGIDAYIPPYSKPTDISNYVYDEQQDSYTDRGGRTFYFKQHCGLKEKKGKRGRPRKSVESIQERHRLYKRIKYVHIDEETKKKSTLQISPGWRNHIKKQKEKLSTDQGKQIYKKRMHDVEGVFANIKKNLRFTSFNLRSFAGVNIEWTLISLAHNLKKILKPAC